MRSKEARLWLRAPSNSLEPPKEVKVIHYKKALNKGKFEKISYFLLDGSLAKSYTDLCKN